MMTATQYEWENKIDGNQTTNQFFFIGIITLQCGKC